MLSDLEMTLDELLQSECCPMNLRTITAIKVGTDQMHK